MRFIHASGERPLDGYTIKRGLGRGGFGEVYHAVSDGGKDVALKLVQRSLEVELRGVGQCLNLKHQNLVGLYDVRESASGDHWIVMELMAGETLDQAIARHPQGMPPEEALAWLRGLGEGVGHLHDQGIVHRDMKPGNIFREEGIVKVGDYGLSKFISASKRSGQTGSVGTVHYMAPEVAGGRYGKELDLYAVGIILYEMLAGRVPFDGESPGEILMKHLTAAPNLGPVPPAFRPVVARLLNKNPRQRYSSVQAMLADLNGYLAAPPGADDWQEAEYVPAAPEAVVRVSEPAAPAPPPRRKTPAGPPPFSLVSYGFIAALMATGVGILVGTNMHRPYYYSDMNGAGYGFGAGFVMFGGLLLLLVILRRVAAWIAARRHGRPLPAPTPFRAFVVIALLLAAGIGILVGTSWYQPFYYDRVGGFGAAAYAFGTGILIFGGQLLLFMLIRGMSEWTRSRNDPRDPLAAETPNGPGATQAGRPIEQTGAWQPRSPVA